MNLDFKKYGLGLIKYKYNYEAFREELKEMLAEESSVCPFKKNCYNIRRRKNGSKSFEIDLRGSEPSGHGRLQSRPLSDFRSRPAPREVALVEVKDLRKTYGYGRVVSQLSLSKERTVPVCPSFGECGGCQIMHMAYPAQLEFKKKMAEETFRRIGHLELKVKDIIGMEEPYHFRNKVQVPFRDMGGEIRAGF